MVSSGVPVLLTPHSTVSIWVLHNMAVMALFFETHLQNTR
jgi:hypothetical protein